MYVHLHSLFDQFVCLLLPDPKYEFQELSDLLGYPMEKATWEPYSCLANSKETVEEALCRFGLKIVIDEKKEESWLERSKKDFKGTRIQQFLSV